MCHYKYSNEEEQFILENEGICVKELHKLFCETFDRDPIPSKSSIHRLATRLGVKFKPGRRRDGEHRGQDIVSFVCENCETEFSQKYFTYEKKFKKYNKCLCKKCVRKENPHIQESMNAGRKKVYPELTIVCKYCNNDFVVKYGERDRKFCSKECQISGGFRKNSPTVSQKKHNSLCVVCKEEFSHYGERVTCGRGCSSKLLSSSRIGDGNPNFKKEEDKSSSLCVKCGEEFSYTRYGLHKGQERKFCSKDCKDGFDTRLLIQDNELYTNNKQYSKDWRKIRSSIIERDKQCVLCNSDGGSFPLEVHHIDDDSLNNNESNLVTLCKRCHNLTMFNRQFWQNVFIALGSKSKVVKKGWGFEIHLFNNNLYCLKYLAFFKGKKLSLHTHKLKTESWFCSWGHIKCRLIDGEGEDTFNISPGDKIDVFPGVHHQLIALRNSIIIEVSTTSYPEDSIRLEIGDILDGEGHKVDTITPDQFTSATTQPCTFIEASTHHEDSDSYRIRS
jgi:mannose-6-phosphate isomerase-like protein (cupin superfamily)